MMTLVTAVDNSKFWTSVARYVMASYLVLACIFMYQVDVRLCVCVRVCVCVYIYMSIHIDIDI